MTDREIDRELVARAQRGDKQAFTLLVEKYQRKLARLLSRLIRDPAEVEDVTQEAFIRAYRALPSFRGDSAFYTWLYRIASTTARSSRGLGRGHRPRRTWSRCVRFDDGSSCGHQHAGPSPSKESPQRAGRSRVAVELRAESAARAGGMSLEEIPG